MDDYFAFGRVVKRRRSCIWHNVALSPFLCSLRHLRNCVVSDRRGGNTCRGQHTPVISTTFPTIPSLCNYNWSSRIVVMTKHQGGMGGVVGKSLPARRVVPSGSLGTTVAMMQMSYTPIDPDDCSIPSPGLGGHRRRQAALNPTTPNVTRFRFRSNAEAETSPRVGRPAVYNSQAA
jgi:hypothetical protein